MKNIFMNRIEFDNLIFADRNKDYGAYLLRKGYNFNVVISVFIASLIVCILVVIPFLITLRKQNRAGNMVKPRYVEVIMENMEPPKEEIIIPPSIDPPPKNAIENIKYVAPVVVDTVLPMEKVLQTNDAVIAANQDSSQVLVAGTGSNDVLITGQDGEASDEPFMIVEVLPTFKGGDIEKFREWVQKKAIYPSIAQDNGIQGKVFLTFVVERDGSVSTVKILKGVDKSLDDEAVKAILASPKWSPGLQRGRAVRFRYQITLVFSMGK